MHKISEQIGLTGILQRTFPKIWQEIFTLASFLIASDKPVMYCEDWLTENEWAEVGSMSSQRISELLVNFNESNRNQFYRAWSQYIQERVLTESKMLLPQAVCLFVVFIRFFYGKTQELNAHIYFNSKKAVKDKNELYGHIAKLKEIAATKGKNSKFNKDIQKYLDVQEYKDGEVISVHVREDIVVKSLETAGWFILLSDHIVNSQEAYDTYRMKDVVEKSFWKYKNSPLTKQAKDIFSFFQIPLPVS